MVRVSAANDSWLLLRVKTAAPPRAAPDPVPGYFASRYKSVTTRCQVRTLVNRHLPPRLQLRQGRATRAHSGEGYAIRPASLIAIAAIVLTAGCGSLGSTAAGPPASAGTPSSSAEAAASSAPCTTRACIVEDAKGLKGTVPRTMP